jgi:hypothetical protein
MRRLLVSMLLFRVAIALFKPIKPRAHSSQTR